MAKRLAGKPVVEKMTEELQRRIATLAQRGLKPKLRMIRVGEQADDLAYEHSIMKKCAALSIACEVVSLASDVSQAVLNETIVDANEDPEVHGMLLFRPLPAHLDIEQAKKLIEPIKDVDCMSPMNIGNLLNNDHSMMVPCTSQAIVTLLDYYQIPLQGADIVVVGASFVVGRPLAMLLVDRFATVTICNVHTRDLASYTKRADIVVSATGVAKLLQKDHFHSQSVVIDVGINLDEKGQLCGDVDFANVVDHVRAITPTVGGVGTVTTMVLLSQVVSACEALHV